MIIKILSTGQIVGGATDADIKPGSKVLVQIDNIVEEGMVTCSGKCGKFEKVVGDKEAAILREETAEDENLSQKFQKKADNYLDEARQKAFRHGLNIKILSSNLSFDEKKLTFYFSAQNRVDFRSLVSDMSQSFAKIIRLQQVGPRDEAKLFGGFGKCGRELCCRKFNSNLDNAPSASKKDQVSCGLCGKPMCCLVFEEGVK